MLPDGRWWLDDEGNRRSANDGQFVGRTLAERRHAFRHLGLVEINVSRAFVHAAWDVRRVALGSLLAAFEALSIRPQETTVFLDTYFGGWNREIFLNRNLALERMGSLAGYKDTEPYGGIKVQYRDPVNVREEGDMIRSAFERWDRNRVFTNAGEMEEPFSRFALIFRPDKRDERLEFSYIGADSAAVRVFGEDWARTAIGREACRSQPDFEFDDRVCAAYGEVLRTGEPHVDHVRAPIRRDGADPVWVPYRRLVLPAETPSGTPLVISVCDVRQDIAIPFMSA